MSLSIGQQTRDELASKLSVTARNELLAALNSLQSQIDGIDVESVYIPVEIEDPGDDGNIPGSQSGWVHMTCGTEAELRGLTPALVSGIRITLNLYVSGGGSIEFVLTETVDGTNRILTFGQAGDAICLESVGVSDQAGAEWQMVWNRGVALSAP